MKFKKLLALGLSGVMCLSMAACGQKDAPAPETSETPSAPVADKAQEKTITLTESWDFSFGFYPVVTEEHTNNYAAGYWTHNFYDTLVKYDEKGELTGALAERWEVSEDGKTYTFHLRPDVKFSDGTPLTSDAVKQSFEAIDDSLGVYNGSFGKLSTLFEELLTPDENTFVMKLTSPYYGALNDLTMMMPMAVVNPKAFEGGVEKVFENCKNATMGTGPYMFDSRDGDTTTFVRNPYYWGTAPEVDVFKVKAIPDNDAKLLALRNGEIDAILGVDKMSTDGFDELSKEAGFGSAVDTASNRTHYLGMNLAAAPFDDPLVRQALALTIDQQGLESSVFNGLETAAEQLFPKDKPFCNVEQTTYETNLDKAKELLAQAGYTDSDGDGIVEKDGKPLTVRLIYSQSLSSVDDAVLAIAAQMKKVGFDTSIKGSDMMSWYGEMMAGNYELSFYYTYGSAYDPFTVMTNINPELGADPVAAQFAAFLPDSGIIKELDSTDDTERVQEIYTQVLQTISDQVLAVPVSYMHELALWNDSVISGYDFCSDPSYIYVPAVHLK